MYFYEIPMNDEKMFKYPLELVKQLKGKNIWASLSPIKELKSIENSITQEYLKNRISELKDKKLKEILTKFEANLENLDGGLEVEDIGVVDCGKQHLTNITGLIKVLETNKVDKTHFKMYDNSLRELTLDELKKIELGIILKGQEQYAKKWKFEDAINSAETIEELEVIEWK